MLDCFFDPIDEDASGLPADGISRWSGGREVRTLRPSMTESGTQLGGKPHRSYQVRRATIGMIL